MIIEKIEKLAELSLIKCKMYPKIENQAQSKAALQSCFYNLQNLKKKLQDNKQQQKNTQKRRNHTLDEQKNRNSQYSIRLPQISITNMRNQSIITNNNFSSSRQVGTIFQHSYLGQVSFQKNSRSQINESLLRNARISSILQKKTDQMNKQKKEQKIILEKSQNKQNRLSQKASEFRKRKIHRAIVGLSKNQRYFEETEVKIQDQVVQKLGLYQATNIYKSKNINKFLKEGYEDKFKPVINLKFATFSLCNRNEFFLTDNSCIPEINEADNFRQPNKRDTQRKNTNSAQKPKGINQNIKQYNITLSQKSQVTQQSQHVQVPRNPQWILTIQNYQVVKNQQYYGFKTHNIKDWNELNFILHKITLYLRKVKISMLSFKFQKELFMKQMPYLKKVQQKVLEGLLKIKIQVECQIKKQVKTIRLFNSKEEIIRQLIRLWRDRKNLQIKKRNKQKQKDILNWLCLRMISQYKIKAGKRRAQERARILNQKLKNGDWDYQVQIHIPSFSQSQFVRETTQYMEHYQNMFYHMWKSSNKQFILIIPAINQNILQLFQQRIKLTKNINLICPQSHQLYPKSLPLSACLLYSKDALCKVKQILQGKRGIIIPGRRAYNYSLYQYYLSQLLNCPLFSTLNHPKQLGDNKQLWAKYEIKTSSFINIQPDSTLQNVIDKFSQLICQSPRTKVWILKMNGQFNGRGIAKFNADSSKKIKQILLQQNSLQTLNSKVRQLTKKQIKNQIILYLQKHFRLKLKINFQNCLFRVEEYIKKFLQNGGIIEQYIQQCQTYQFCYKLEPGYSNYSHLYILDQLQQEKYICCTQNYQINFVTKSSLFLNSNIPKVLKDFSKKVQRILKSQKYLGYVSVTVLYLPKTEQYFALQIKPYMTVNSSMNYFLKLFTNRPPKQATNRRIGNLVSNTQIQSKNDIINIQNHNHHDNGLIFLFIPVIIFTDVDQLTRSQFIQNLVLQSWNKVPTRLFSQSLALDSSDAFSGHLFISLGLTLGLLIFGKANDIKRMKKQAVDCSRELFDKIQSIRLCRGKKQTRDVFQFGDLIRAITKIR